MFSELINVPIQHPAVLQFRVFGNDNCVAHRVARVQIITGAGSARREARRDAAASVAVRAGFPGALDRRRTDEADLARQQQLPQEKWRL